MAPQANATGSAASSADTPDPAVALPNGFTSQFATVSGVRIHYVIGGAGSPVLLLHGWPETWFAWRYVMPLLAQQHTVIAADLRGFGGSAITAPGYDRKAMAADMFGLMTQLGYSTTTLVGHDWGGSVAFQYAALHRSAVDKLIVIEGGPIGPWNQQIAIPYLSNPLWFYGFFQIPNYAEVVLDGHVAQFLDHFYTDPTVHQVPFPPAAIAYYEASFSRPGRFAASLQPWRAISQEITDTTQEAQTPLTIPVLGVGAQFGSGALIAEVMQNVASNVTSNVVAGAGHFIPEEQPATIANLILNF